MNFSASCNIYEFNACLALDLYAGFVAGGADCQVCVISWQALGAAARDAVCKSVERVGYDAAACAWVQLTAGGGAPAPAGEGGEGRAAADGAGGGEGCPAAGAADGGPVSACVDAGEGRANPEVAAAAVVLAADDVFSLVEGLDPRALIVADEQSAQVVSAAYRQKLETNKFCRVYGRNTAVLEDFTKMLETPQAKQTAWRVLKQL